MALLLLANNLMHALAPHASLNLAALTRAEQADGWLAGFALRQLPKGFLLSTPGTQRDQVFIVRSGRLRVYLDGANRELSLSFLEAGDIYTTHTPTYVKTVAPSALWVMDIRTFAHKLAREPELTPVIMRVMGRLLTNAVALIDDLAFRDVPARLARFLLGQAQRRSQPHEQGCLIPLDLSMEDIASLLGSTRQSVSSLINQWEREGVLQRQGRRSLLIRSLAALQARCPASVGQPTDRPSRER
jgi:CRP-like cAMP-binding protein